MKAVIAEKTDTWTRVIHVFNDVVGFKHDAGGVVIIYSDSKLAQSDGTLAIVKLAQGQWIQLAEPKETQVGERTL